MSDTIGRITVPGLVSSGLTFPLVTDQNYGFTQDRPVVVHRFGSLDAKQEQRFIAGIGPRKFAFRRQHLSLRDRNSLVAFWEGLQGAWQSFIYNVPNADQTFTDRLYVDLQAKGVRCWFAPHDIQGGRKIHEQIDEAIRVYDKLLLILSDASMNSNWVKTEIANARAREEQQKRQMLFPISLVPYEQIKRWILFDGDTGIDSAREIREYHIPDFSNWKDHDSYQKAFERLLRDLKAEAREAGA